MSNKYAGMLGRRSRTVEETPQPAPPAEAPPVTVIAPTAAPPPDSPPESEEMVGTYIRLPFSVKRELQGLLPRGVTMQDVMVEQVKAWIAAQREKLGR